MELEAEKLISAIEKRSVLYNCKHKSYTNKIVIEKTWEEVANEMDFPVSVCKAKWQSLRNAYSRHIRNEKEERSQLHGKKRKIWYLADSMFFLKDYVNTQRISSGGKQDEMEFYDNSTTLSEQSDKFNTVFPEDPFVENVQLNAPFKEIESSHGNSNTICFEKTESTKTNDKSQRNSNFLFLKSLMYDLEKLSSQKQRAFKMHVLAKLDQFLQEEEN